MRNDGRIASAMVAVGGVSPIAMSYIDTLGMNAFAKL
jgi:hypothetical protein